MADAKVSALTEDTTVLSTDLGYTVEDPGGTPTSKKATWLNILKGQLLGLLTSDGDLVTRTSGAAARLTRADLAADTAFSSVYAPLHHAGELLGYAEVDTQESTTSATYTDLTTSGPSVTFSVPTGWTWTVLVETAVKATNNSGGSALASPSLDSATPSDNDSAGSNNGSSISTASMAQFTGLTAGSHTIKLQYRSSGGTSTFTYRRLKVTLVSSS